MYYILIAKSTNKISNIRNKKPLCYTDNLLLAEVESLPDKYDYLEADSIREVTDTWTETQEDYDDNGEIVAKEVVSSRTYLTCDLVAKFRPQPTVEQLEKQKRAKYEKLCEKYIRQKYSISDELGIQRKRNIEPEKYEVYFAYVEECLSKAHKEIYGS